MMPMGMIFGAVHRKVNVKKINLAISEQVVRYLPYLQENLARCRAKLLEIEKIIIYKLIDELIKGNTQGLCNNTFKEILFR